MERTHPFHFRRRHSDRSEPVGWLAALLAGRGRGCYHGAALPLALAHGCHDAGGACPSLPRSHSHTQTSRGGPRSTARATGAARRGGRYDTHNASQIKQNIRDERLSFHPQPARPSAAQRSWQRALGGRGWEMGVAGASSDKQEQTAARRGGGGGRDGTRRREGSRGSGEGAVDRGGSQR